MMYGQMTAGSWIYIGSQGIVQGTYETFAEAGRQHYGGDWSGQMDPHRGPRRHGRRAAARRDHGRRLDARDRMRPEPHRDAPQVRLPGQARREPRRSDADPRQAAQTRRSRSACSATPRRFCPQILKKAQDRRGFKPALVTDQTSAHDPANGYLPEHWSLEKWKDLRKREPDEVATVGARIDRQPRAGDPAVQGDGHSVRRLRQQHPPGGEERGREERVRLPGLRAGVHPAAVLRRQGTVPLGRAFRRSRGHRADRRQGARAVSRGREPRSAGSTSRRRESSSRACPRASAGSGSASATSPGSRSTRWCAAGELQGADRDRPRPSRRRLGGEPEPRDRSDARRLRRGVGLAAAQPDAEHRGGRDLGLVPPRRRRRHGLLAARRHGDRVRRHRGGRAAHRARAVERPGERRDAARGRGLRGGDRLRTRAGASICRCSRDAASAEQPLPLAATCARSRATGPPLELDPALPAGAARRLRGGRAHRRLRQAGLRHQHRLRPAVADAHPGRGARATADQHRAVARRRHRARCSTTRPCGSSSR